MRKSFGDVPCAAVVVGALVVLGLLFTRTPVSAPTPRSRDKIGSKDVNEAPVQVGLHCWVAGSLASPIIFRTTVRQCVYWSMVAIVHVAPGADLSLMG